MKGKLNHILGMFNSPKHPKPDYVCHFKQGHSSEGRELTLMTTMCAGRFTPHAKVAVQTRTCQHGPDPEHITFCSTVKNPWNSQFCIFKLLTLTQSQCRHVQGKQTEVHYTIYPFIIAWYMTDPPSLHGRRNQHIMLSIIIPWGGPQRTPSPPCYGRTAACLHGEPQSKTGTDLQSPDSSISQNLSARDTRSNKPK